MDNLHIIFYSIIIGSVVFRIIPRPIEQMLFSLFVPAVMWHLGYDWSDMLLPYAVTVWMVLRGHGHNMDGGRPEFAHTDYEWYEIAFSMDKIHGKINERLYDFIGMAVSGLTYTIPLGLATDSYLLAAVGSVKAAAYLANWLLWDTGRVKSPTLLGEWFTGGSLWGLLAAYCVFGG